MKHVCPTLLLALTACASATFHADSCEPMSRFGQVRVLPFRVALPEGQLPTDEVVSIARASQHELEDWIRDANLFHGGGPILTVEGTIISYEPGEKVARTLIGTGSGRVEADIVVKDEEGRIVLRGKASGSVVGTAFRENADGSARMLTREIANYLRKSCESERR